MRLGLLYLGRGSGTDHFIYSHARVMAQICDLTCYLSAESTLLDLYNELPCKVQAFEWQRGYKSLMKAMISNRDTSGVSAAILRDSPDMVVNTHLDWWSTVVHGKLTGKIPLAGVIHDVTPHPGFMGMLMKAHSKTFPPKVDCVVALSDYTFRELVQKYPTKTCISSRHGVFHPDPRVDPQEVASRRNKMLFLGRIECYKGVDVLVDAYGIAKRANSDVELDIVGKGEISQHTKAKISELGIGGNNAYVSDEELRQIVGTHGVMVLPYTSATQSGVAAIALGNGLAGIATNVGALPEQIVDGRNGIIVPPNDAPALAAAMLRVAEDKDLAQKMSQESITIGREDYSWEKISTQLLHDLEDYLVQRPKYGIS